MSNDIFDERESMHSAQEIASKLRVMYNESISSVGDRIDVDVRIRRTKLGLLKYTDELLTQIVMDVSEILCQYDIDPKDIKW